MDRRSGDGRKHCNLKQIQIIKYNTLSNIYQRSTGIRGRVAGRATVGEKKTRCKAVAALAVQGSEGESHCLVSCCNLPPESWAQCSLSSMRSLGILKKTHVVPSILTRSRFLGWIL